MFLNPSKLLFFFTLILGTLITISANSWLGAWMGLEINLLSFIPLMMDTNNLMSTEASLKYFLTQALASSVLLFSIIIYMVKTNMVNFLGFDWINLVINSCLLLKMGAAPFHFWFPTVMEGLSWNMGLVLLTIQKIAPLTLLSYTINMNLIFFFIILSIIIGSIGGLNQTSIRKLMAFSSINHLGWILTAMIMSENLWLAYFSFYCILSVAMISLFNLSKLFYINQMFSLFNNSPIIKFSFFSTLLSLGGLPPFLGFIPKWLVIQAMINSNLMILMVFMVSFTLVTLYFYLRLYFAASLINYNEMSWNFKTFNQKSFFLTSLFNFFSIMGLFLIFFIYFVA
uniref:NADH-ubiquinone oxidoreductase chain 2 n=1 Tax=Edwardsina sp. AJJ-2011 TaxID=1017311 RepID=V9I0Q8_9DIPT|nr:NADH dehydrogenase subunit 2 [Edwardsina sp. AJJ-2011]